MLTAHDHKEWVTGPRPSVKTNQRHPWRVNVACLTIATQLEAFDSLARGCSSSLSLQPTITTTPMEPGRPWPRLARLWAISSAGILISSATRSGPFSCYYLPFPTFDCSLSSMIVYYWHELYEVFQAPYGLRKTIWVLSSMIALPPTKGK